MTMATMPERPAETGDDDTKKIIPVPELETIVRWEDIGGCREAKRELKRLTVAIAHPEVYEVYGTDPPKGILLQGEPGCGKTLLAKAFAHYCKAELRVVTRDEIGSHYYDKAMMNLAACFKEARSLAKKGGACVLYFDELDGFAATRDTYIHAEDRKIVTTFNTYLDGLDKQRGVFIIASTNRPESLDPSITRPGRLDRIIKVPLPDEEERAEIFCIHLRNRMKKSKILQLSHGTVPFMERINYDELARLTPEYSGADIEEIVRHATEKKVYQLCPKLVNGKIIADYIDATPLRMHDLLEEISQYDLTRGNSHEKGKTKIGFHP